MKLYPVICGALILVASAIAATGCSRSPADALAAIENSAAAGDAEKFASGFTADSRPFAEALIRIQKDVRKDEPLKSPVENIFRSKVVSEKVTGNRAVVTVEGPSGRAGLVFIREDGTWKLDVAATELDKATRPASGEPE